MMSNFNPPLWRPAPPGQPARRGVPPTAAAGRGGWERPRRDLESPARRVPSEPPAVADLPDRTLTALPVYNERGHLRPVLKEVLRYAGDVLVVDDGSSDGSGGLLDDLAADAGFAAGRLCVLHLPENRGYGAALAAAFGAAGEREYDRLVTIDCDGQHQPSMIPELARALDGTPGTTDGAGDPVDVVSGSRYLAEFDGDSAAPEDRRAINRLVTAFLNERLGPALGVRLTDAFCGFKAYRVASLAKLDVTDPGYAMPLQVWVQVAAAGLRVAEYAVPRVYLEEERSFGGSLDRSEARLAHYRAVLAAELAKHPRLPNRPTAEDYLVLPDAAF